MAKHTDKEWEMFWKALGCEPEIKHKEDKQVECSAEDCLTCQLCEEIFEN